MHQNSSTSAQLTDRQQNRTKPYRNYKPTDNMGIFELLREFLKVKGLIINRGQDLYTDSAYSYTVNVHNDYRVYATEFINFLSIIIATRVKKLFKEKKLAEKYSFNQLMRYIAKLKKVRLGEDKKWRTSITVAFVKDVWKELGIVD